MLAVTEQLLDEGLFATIDVTGRPFHRVTTITRHTLHGKLIFWLDPDGLDDDLTTVMAPHDDDLTNPPASDAGGQKGGLNMTKFHITWIADQPTYATATVEADNEEHARALADKMDPHDFQRGQINTDNLSFEIQEIEEG